MKAKRNKGRIMKSTAQKQKELDKKDPLGIEEQGLRLSWIRFIDEYLKNGNNGQEAYKVAYPDVKNNNVAKANASRLLTNANIKNEIQNKLTAQTCTNEFIINGLVDIATRYRGEKTLMAAVRSLEILGKINGMLVDTKRIAFTAENPAIFSAVVKEKNKEKFDKMVESGERIAE